MKTGLIHLYHGNGKGKTTAAMGLCLRAAASGKNVVIVQFLKDGSSSELKILRSLSSVTVLTANDAVFTFAMTDEEKVNTKAACEELFEKALSLVENQLEVLLLDEVCAAVKHGFLSGPQLHSFLNTKPDALEVILTGRNPADFMLEEADYITEMICRRHPYEKGIKAREGIEY